MQGIARVDAGLLRFRFGGNLEEAVMGVDEAGDRGEGPEAVAAAQDIVTSRYW